MSVSSLGGAGPQASSKCTLPAYCHTLAQNHVAVIRLGQEFDTQVPYTTDSFLYKNIQDCGNVLVKPVTRLVTVDLDVHGILYLVLYQPKQSKAAM